MPRHLITTRLASPWLEQSSCSNSVQIESNLKGSTMTTRRSARTIPAVIFLVLSCAPFADAQDLKIVSPNEFANVDADDFQNFNCCPFPFRFQQLFPSDDFASLPGRGALLTGFAWRPDVDLVDSPRDITLGNYALPFFNDRRGSTKQQVQRNVGDDVTTVRSGTFTISTNNKTLQMARRNLIT